MGRKKYFCEYCNRFFNDDKNTRLKHLNSVGHINLKKEHYNMFRDHETVLEEESAKKPCRKFHYEGYCPFGGSCTFSHYSQNDLNAIKQDLLAKKQKEILDKPSVEKWLQNYNQKLEENSNKIKKLSFSYEVSPELSMMMPMLPPSLHPYHIQEVINAELNTWG